MTQNNSSAPDSTLPSDPLPDEPLNSRTVPEDLRRQRSEEGYLVAICNSQAEAERGVFELTASGFRRSELVLVSKDVDTLRVSLYRDTYEVNNPTSESKRNGAMAGGVTGVALGAAIGIAGHFLVSRGAASWLSSAVIGGAVGAGLGVLGGRWMGVRQRRAPANAYDDRGFQSEIMVGAAIDDKDPKASRGQIAASLLRAGLKTMFVEGEAA